MPKRGPVELLLLFQLILGAAFAGIAVWAVLAWIGLF